MIRGFEIIFFEPGEGGEPRKGRLIFDENGKDLIEMNGTWADIFRVIDVLYAKSVETGELYTLVNCVFSSSVDSLQQFRIHELYRGAHLGKATKAECLVATGRMTGLTEWINQPRFKPELSAKFSEPERLTIKESYDRVYVINDHYTLEICQFCHGLFDRQQAVLKNESYSSVISKVAVPRLELQRNPPSNPSYL